MSHADLYQRLSIALSDNPNADMNALVAAAGVSRATLYRNVGNRDAVVQATARYALSALDAALAMVSDTLAPRALFRALFEVLVPLGPMYRVVGHLDLASDPVMAQEVARQTAEMHELVAYAQEQGVVRSELSAWWVSELFDAIVWTTWTGVAQGELAAKHAPALAFDTFLRAVGRGS